MEKHSAGLLLYRWRDDAPARAMDDRLEVLIVHPGGPYWARRDDGWWSIPKGEVEHGEDRLTTAEREFREELGLDPPGGPRLPLGEVVQAGGKHVHAWAVAGDLDVSELDGATFSLEWPPRSGRFRDFPEVDRASWCSLDTARVKLLPAQVALLDRLGDAVRPRNDPEAAAATGQ